MIIKSTNGFDITVDDRDYEFLNRHNWYVDQKGYARTVLNNKNVYMHRLIYGRIPPSYVVDHINRDKLDNRMENLRAATKAQNQYNGVYGKSKTGYIGVKEKKGRFAAETSINNKEVYIGVAGTAVEAAKLRDAFVYTLRGEFAVLNFPDEKPAYAAWEPPARLKRYLE